MLARLRFAVYLIITASSVSAIVACKKLPEKTVSIDQVVAKEMGKDFTIELNQSKTFALCKQTRTTDHIRSVFKYCVVRVHENKIVHSGSYQQGSVRWIDNNSIEVRNTDKSSTEPTVKIIPINSSQP